MDSEEFQTVHGLETQNALTTIPVLVSSYLYIQQIWLVPVQRRRYRDGVLTDG